MNVKVELVEKTTKYTGEKYWYVQVNGEYISGSIERTIEKANERFAGIVELATKYPTDKEEVVKSLEITVS